MASIKVHQDLFGFERKRGGFTTRQRTGLVCVNHKANKMARSI